MAFAADTPPRAARSVHLQYSAPSEAEWFHVAMKIEQSVKGSYFMACGWDTGYFGLQQIGSTDDKVVIFSVWDPTRGDDPNAVKAGDRVEVVFEGPGVRIRRFGGEGTGAQCMAPFPWKTGESYQFLVRAGVEGDRTAYSAWIFRPARNDWWHLATFRTRTSGRLMRGFYSFVEDFRRDTQSVGETRRARFHDTWIRPPKGEWLRIDGARFTASNADWESKENIDAWTEGDDFILATGGDIKPRTALRSRLTRAAPDEKPPVVPPADGRPPE